MNPCPLQSGHEYHPNQTHFQHQAYSDASIFCFQINKKMNNHLAVDVITTNCVFCRLLILFASFLKPDQKVRLDMDKIF